MTTDRDDGIDWERLARYVSGESSATEAAAVERWAAADPGNAEALARAGQAWASAGAGARQPVGDVDAAWARMSQRMDEAAVPVSLASRGSQVVHLMRVAAVIVVMVGGGMVWRAQRAETPTVATATRYATKPGERRTLVLRDSTRIVLGVASELAVSTDYGEPVRDVGLRGEASFSVRHDAAHPFRVTIAGRVVEDLGTEFSLRAYTDGDTLVVAVRSGTVAVRRAGEMDSLVAHAGQMVVMPATGAGSITVASASSLHEELKGRIVFDNATLAQVAAELPRWFDVDVRLADSALATRHVTTSFESNAGLDGVLDEIARILGVSVALDGRVATFRKGR